MAKNHVSAKPRRKYDEEFKNDAVRLATAGNRSVADVARSLGISENLLYRWKGAGQLDGQKGTVSQQDYDQLRQQLRQSEQEREILKKALAIFSRMT
jgi:transposase